jgi:hypothetical protein
MIEWSKLFNHPVPESNIATGVPNTFTSTKTAALN